jgi:4'-phosphopantetheinyl transferase
MSPPALALSQPTSVVLERHGPEGPALTAAEQQRMARLQRPGDRDDFLAAHLLVRTCAARLLGVGTGEISIVQRCATCGGPHGRPEIDGYPELGVSLAHSRGVVAAAAGPGRVGADVEAYPPAGDLAAADLSAALSAAEIRAVESAADPARALLLAWARKEACLKAGLVGVDGLDRFDLSTLPLDPLTASLRARSVPQDGWTVHDWWDGRAGAVGAVVAPAGAGLTLSTD